MKVKNIANWMCGLLLIALAVGMVSCKEEDPTIAEIIVVNEDGERIPGAAVRLYTEDPDASDDAVPRFDLSSTTDVNGQVVFDFSDQAMPGQTGFAVLDVSVEATYENVDYSGIGIVKVVEHETVTEDIIVTP